MHRPSGIQVPPCRLWLKASSALIAGAWLCLSSPSGAADGEATFKQGMDLYQAGDFAAAADHFERAYAAEAKPLYLFTWAQAEIGRDDCRAAVALFRRYLDTNPPEQNKKAAETRMATCAERLVASPPDAGVDVASTNEPVTDAGAETPPAEAAAPIAPPAVAPAPIPTPVVRDRGAASPWYTDPVGMILLGTGVIAAGVGTGFLVASHGKEADAEDNGFDRYDEHRSALDTAKRQRTIGGIAGGVGVALMAAGVIRLIMREPEATPSVGVWFTPRVAGASVSRSF